MLLASKVPRAVPGPPELTAPVPDSDGGGATTVGVPSFGADEDNEDREPVPPDIPVEGGGATTFGPS
jgi:hypothetical protein